MRLGMEVVPLMLQGEFDEALSQAAAMWDFHDKYPDPRRELILACRPFTS